MNETEKPDATLIALRERAVQLEIEVRVAQGRLEEVRDLIGKLEAPKRGRPRRVVDGPSEQTLVAAWTASRDQAIADAGQ